MLGGGEFGFYGPRFLPGHWSHFHSKDRVSGGVRYVRGWLCQGLGMWGGGGGLGIKGARVSNWVGGRVSRDGVGYPLVYPLKVIYGIINTLHLPPKEHGTRDTIPPAPSELWLMQAGGTHPTGMFF